MLRIDTGADPEHEMREFQRAALTTLTSEQRARVEQNITDKDVVRRFRELSATLRDVVQGEKRLIAGESPEDRAAQYEDLVCHIRELWRDAAAAFDRSRYSTATFLAIACMEEVGKGGVARWQLFWDAQPEPSSRRRSRGRGVLYSHPKKHLLVAGQGALINARLDHLFGVDRITRFLDDVESGTIEQLRQTALYADHDGTGLLLPERRITRDDALFYTVLAGELMAEVLGVVPETWTILLDEVKGFERAHGLARN